MSAAQHASSRLTSLNVEFTAKGVPLSFTVSAEAGDEGRSVTFRYEGSGGTAAAEEQLRVSVEVGPASSTYVPAAGLVSARDVLEAIDTAGLPSIAQKVALTDTGPDTGCYSLGLGKPDDVWSGDTPIGNPVYAWADGAWQALESND